VPWTYEEELRAGRAIREIERRLEALRRGFDWGSLPQDSGLWTDLWHLLGQVAMLYGVRVGWYGGTLEDLSRLHERKQEELRRKEEEELRRRREEERRRAGGAGGFLERLAGA
jgi:hypothetical protein